MLHKQFELLETKTDAETGTFEATVAVFHNVDRGGDRILPGAFKGTLEKWQESGDPIPVILSHQWDNPMAHIGVVQDAKETDKGLWVKGQLDVKDNDVARQVHKLMARRSLKEFSFGYDVPKGGEKRAKDGANELLDVNLVEVGPTLKGMNPATELHAVKSALETADLPDAETQRKEAERVAREETERSFPSVPPVEAVVEPPRVKQDAPPTPEQMRILMSMISQAQAYVATNPDDEDVQAMNDILSSLKEIRGEPGSEDDSGKSAEALRKRAAKVEREANDRLLPTPFETKADIERAKEALDALELFNPDEVAGLKSGMLKAVWSAAYINDLSDSAFLYVESGGDKDSEGKTTPRSLRHFPYKDDSGAVDLPHLQNALARIPQSNLPQDVKDRLTTRAQRILDNNKSVDVADKEPVVRSVDPLRKRADDLALEFASDGRSLRRSPKHVEQPKPKPEMDLVALKQRMHDEIVTHLKGTI